MATTAVIAVPPKCTADSVNVLATVILDNKPTEEQLGKLNEMLQTSINEPYVLLTTTPEFVDSLKKDMPENG